MIHCFYHISGSKMKGVLADPSPMQTALGTITLQRDNVALTGAVRQDRLESTV